MDLMKKLWTSLEGLWWSYTELLSSTSHQHQFAVYFWGFLHVLVAAYCVFCAWFFGGLRRVRNKVRLDGKTVLITGANAGIGKETAVDLATRGARVIMACRNPAKAQAALSEVRRRSGNINVVFRELDLSDLNSVRTLADQILNEEERLDVLINNAGTAIEKFQLSHEGFDINMATNHVGHFVLTLSLLDMLKKSAPSRVVTVASQLHTQTPPTVDYTNKASKGINMGISGRVLGEYCRSKLANVLFTKELARRLASTGVTAYSLHPGFIHSNIWEKGAISLGNVKAFFAHYLMLPFLTLFTLSEKDGAQTSIYCATEESIEDLSGGYFSNCRLDKASKQGQDATLAKQLWEVSCEATGFDPDTMLAK